MTLTKNYLCYKQQVIIVAHILKKNLVEKMNDYMTKENYLANIYLKILEYYETDCLEEYFYLVRDLIL